MAILTAKEITNLYLYGKTTTPQNKVDAFNMLILYQKFTY